MTCRPSLAVFIVSIFLVLGCRDATSPPPIDDDPADSQGSLSEPFQLTYSASDDRAPRWSPDGDSVYYHTEGVDPFLRTKGLLAAVPAHRGVMRPLIPSVQFPSGPGYWLTSPAPSASGRLAYKEMWSIDDDGELCRRVVRIFCFPDHPRASSVSPALREVRVRVRDLDSRGLLDEDPLLRVRFDGLEAIPFPGPPRWRVTFHPFQRLFIREHAQIVTPSWSPDGTRIVLSDGLGLFIWTPVNDDTIRIPGTGDGIQPSWSPDGSRVVFTRLVRGDSITFQCNHIGPIARQCVQIRTDIFIDGRFIELIAPDGSGARRLGPGDEPAWAPDGGRIVFRNDGRLFTARVAEFRPEAIPGTEGGREPRVSPDGSSIVFSRPGPNGSFDLWVAPLPPLP